jgi:DNA-binding NarL/FixJ family response regulator
MFYLSSSNITEVMPYKVAIADDHNLVRSALAELLSLNGVEVLYQCANGQELLQRMADICPDVVLMDANMPKMDGWQATAVITKRYPKVKVLAVSMLNDDASIIKMIRNGASGYISKDCDADELIKAVKAVMEIGLYYNDRVVYSLKRAITGEAKVKKLLLDITNREKEFLKLCCTELTYREISEEMHVSPRSVDGYRDSLFSKLDVKSRVGLVLYAIKTGLVHVEPAN